MGIQGALLTHFVEPIYLYSVTLGSLFHAHHMFRAVAGRIQQSVAGLPQPYKLNVPRWKIVKMKMTFKVYIFLCTCSLKYLFILVDPLYLSLVLFSFGLVIQSQ